MWYEAVEIFLIIAYAIAIAGEVILLRPLVREHDGHAVSLLGLTTVGFLGLFAALVVSNERNSAAVFSLLGAVAGFLAGRLLASVPANERDRSTTGG